MKKFLNSIFFALTIIIVVITSFNVYTSWYKPHQLEYKTGILENVLSQNSYNPEIAEPLLSDSQEGVHFYDISKLMLNADSVFTYYTTDGYKITYTVEFISQARFNKLDINTRMNILTNIYKVCKTYFQNEYQLDSIAYKDNRFGWIYLNNSKFDYALAECVKRHINDNNNIVCVREVTAEDLDNTDSKFATPDDIGKLGNLLLSTSEFKAVKLSDEEIKEKEIENYAVQKATAIVKRKQAEADSIYMKTMKIGEDKLEKLKESELRYHQLDFRCPGNFLFDRSPITHLPKIGK